MTERQLLKEFQEHAELLVPIPDLHDLQRRGVRRRRIRVAVGAAAVAFTLAVGGTLVANVVDQRLAIEPAQTHPSRTVRTPTPTPDTHLRFLRPGSVHVFGPLDADVASAGAGFLRARFVVPGSSWYWRELAPGADQGLDHMVGGLRMANSAGANPAAPYIRVAVAPISGVSPQRCPGGAYMPVQPLPASVLSAVQALVAPAGVEVLAAPTRVHKFGYEAAHVRFRVTQPCAGGQPVVLWRAFQAGGDVDALSGQESLVPDLRRYVFDVWVVDAGRTQAAVLASHPVDADAGDIAQMQQLLTSIRFQSSR